MQTFLVKNAQTLGTNTRTRHTFDLPASYDICQVRWTGSILRHSKPSPTGYSTSTGELVNA